MASLYLINRLSMNKKSILITGCSSGIGKCAAHALKKRGYRVFATARKQNDVNSLIQSGFESVLLNLDDTDSITFALNHILQKTNGTLDFLFNNGAFGQPGAVEDLTRDVIKQQFETNVFGTQELTNKVIPVMRKQGHGRIIYNSSVLGFVAFKHRGAYCASKYAIEGLADTLRLEIKGTGIFICLIEPGPITSYFRDNAYNKFTQNIDIEKSPNKVDYLKTINRLKQDSTYTTPFTLTPDAVIKKLICALENKKPKARYYVTFPTYLFRILKRILPTPILDLILSKSE